LLASGRDAAVARRGADANITGVERGRLGAAAALVRERLTGR
jgi:hypothetical protein